MNGVSIFRSILLSALAISAITSAQTPQERARLNKMAAEHAVKWRVERDRAESVAVRVGMPIRKELPNGKIKIGRASCRERV